VDNDLLEAIRAIIREKIKQNDERLLDPEELAERLKVPVSWVYEQSRRGRIPTVRIGKYVRFSLNAVLNLKERRTDMGLVQVIQSYGVELRRAGKELVGLCPFHDDQHPSFSVSPEKEKWHCFGCQAGGDVVSFVMRMENVSFKAATKKLGREPLARPPPKLRPEIDWGKATLSRVEAIMREINQKLRLAEKSEWQEEIDLLTREYEILETLAEDLANRETVLYLFNKKDWIESLLAINEGDGGPDGEDS
jgi:excisionase family DNA binding protein